MKKQTPSSTKLVYDNNEAKSNSDICKLWGIYFEDLYTGKDDEAFDKCFHKEISKNLSCYFNEKTNQNIHTLEKTITENEINNQIKTLKIGKSPGQDCISNEHLIYGGKQVINKLKFIYNLILKHEYLPSSLRHGIIIPLYKGNNKDKSNPSSYCAVTLTSVLGKLFEKLF